jgi:multidrug resistance efflux pump
MESRITAQRSGVIASVSIDGPTQISGGDLLAVIDDPS